MKFNLSTIIVIILAMIGIGVVVVAAAGLIQWFVDHFWVILISGAVVFGLIYWLKKSEKNDNAGGPL